MKLSSPRKTTVLFWEDAIDPNNTLRNKVVSKAVKELLNNQFTSKNFEKLKGHRVFSYRTSLKGRLLFTTLRVEGVSHLLILDFLCNHEYGSTKYLKENVLDKFCEKQRKVINNNNNDDDDDDDDDDLDEYIWQKCSENNSGLNEICYNTSKYS